MPLDESHCAVTYKVLVLGDYSVGKTALLRSLTGEDFKQDLRPTVGKKLTLRKIAIWMSKIAKKLDILSKKIAKNFH